MFLSILEKYTHLRFNSYKLQYRFNKNDLDNFLYLMLINEADHYSINLLQKRFFTSRRFISWKFFNNLNSNDIKKNYILNFLIYIYIISIWHIKSLVHFMATIIKLIFIKNYRNDSIAINNILHLLKYE